MSNAVQLSADATNIDIKLQTAAPGGWFAYYWLGDERGLRRLPVVLWTTLFDHGKESLGEQIRASVITTDGVIIDYLSVEELETFIAVLGPMGQAHNVTLKDIMQRRGIDTSKVMLTVQDAPSAQEN